MVLLSCVALCSGLMLAPPAGVAEWRERSHVPDASEAPPEADRSHELDPAHRIRETLITLGPGVVVHGVGQYRANRPEAARTLLVNEVIGLGMVGVGLGGLALTGASPYTVAPFALSTIGGVGLFASSWFADVYAVARPPGADGPAPTRAARVQSEIGYRSVDDPQFRYRHFAVHRVNLRLGRLALEPSGWFALDDRNARLSLAARYRLAGPLVTEESSDGSFWDLEIAGTHHRYDSDGFRIATGEAYTRFRRDLVRYNDAFAGSFVQAGAGVALNRTAYDLPGIEVPADYSELLLAELGFGFYFGADRARSGEARVYYDHRHDGYAAGLLMTGLGSGVAGHFGLDVVGFFSDSFGLRGDVQVGSAVIYGASLVIREGSF